MIWIFAHQFLKNLPSQFSTDKNIFFLIFYLQIYLVCYFFLYSQKLHLLHSHHVYLGFVCAILSLPSILFKLILYSLFFFFIPIWFNVKNFSHPQNLVCSTYNVCRYYFTSHTFFIPHIYRCSWEPISNAKVDKNRKVFTPLLYEKNLSAYKEKWR